jgi:hypothetical protein
MRYWPILLIAAAAFLYWRKQSKTYAGMFSTGWLGNRAGNIPTLADPNTIVGQGSNVFGFPVNFNYGVGVPEPGDMP